MSAYATQKDDLYNGERYYTWNNNRFSWYTASGYLGQLNDAGRRYCYIAF